MNKSGTASQVIAHPSGGGAIKGLGETFAPDLHTGTGNLSVPIALPAGRSGFQPQVTLGYSTGRGNGPFGLGWALGVPGVSRDTTKGVPVYDDDADAFLLSGAEQLVPVASPSPGATRYRPRTEGLFARITHVKGGAADYWEVRGRDGLMSLYGDSGAVGPDSPVVRSPDDSRRIFSWPLTQTRDPFGNRIDYLYEREAAREDGPHHWDQVYLKAIRYGDYGPADAPQFMVSVDFTYEDRPDPFSAYKAGFEIRTTRRCTGIEISTHADAARLTRAYRLVYLDQVDAQAAPANGTSLLHSIEVEGVDGDAREKLPPLEFGYTGFDPGRRRYQALSGVSGALPDRSLAHPDFELADLFGRGLPVVVQIGDTARYWRNLGGGRFDAPGPIEHLPSGVRLGDAGVQLADADGDGHIDMVVSGAPFSGYVPLTVSDRGAARRFVQYAAAPPFALNDPEVRLLDLDGDGDGVADALRTGAQFELFFHDRQVGWNRAETRRRGDLDGFPDVQFGDPRVKLADMSGDGLQDIVFVSAGGVDYWPYLGHGRWGRRVAMGGRIRFPDGQALGGIGFDPKRLLLGDVDGDGVSDLAYVESGRITIWLNQSGNRWADPVAILGTPPLSDADSVRLVDVLGNGTDGILWTYDLRTFGDSTYKFLDLTGGTKPYLLQERNSHTGGAHPGRIRPLDRLLSRRRGAAGNPLALAAAVPGPGGRARRGDRRDLRRQDVDRIPLPPGLLGRRRARVPRLRDGRAVRHRNLRPLPRPGAARRAAVRRGRAAALLPDDAHPHLVPSGHGARRRRHLERAGPRRRVLARGSPAARARPAAGAVRHRSIRRARRRSRPRAPRAAQPARLHPAHRALRARRLTPRRAPVHRHRVAQRRPRNRAPRARLHAPVARLFPLPERQPDDAMGTRRRADDAVRVHRRPRRVRPAQAAARHRRPPRA